MNSAHSPWVVVLAAGSGTRLSSLTQAADGAAVPKQYCSLAGGSTLLEDAVERARRVTSRERVLAIVAREHAPWWRPLLGHFRAGNVIVQPANRGTAIGILLCALHLHARDPDAVIVFLPSDHYIADEATIATSLARAKAAIEREPNALVLLGITPEEADVELGYIVPGAASQDDTFRVERFVEKPSLALAEQLLAQGAVWNSFIFAVTARSLVRLFSREHDAVIERLLYALRVDGWRDGAALARAYERLSAVDFSSHVLAGAASDLRLVPAPACGWTDLGTPARVGRCVEALGARRLRRRDTGARSPLTIDLAAAYTRLQLAV